MALIVCLAASYDPGNHAKVDSLLDLISDIRRAFDGERQPAQLMQ